MHDFFSYKVDETYEYKGIILVSGGRIPLTISYPLPYSYLHKSPASWFMATPNAPIGVLAGLIVLARYNILSFYTVGLSPFTLSDALGPSLRYRRARVGRFLAALSYVSIASTLVDLEAVRKTHLNINRWSNEEVLAWKGSYVSGCSATAVAVCTLHMIMLQF